MCLGQKDRITEVMVGRGGGITRMHESEPIRGHVNMDIKVWTRIPTLPEVMLKQLESAGIARPVRLAWMQDVGLHY